MHNTDDTGSAPDELLSTREALAILGYSQPGTIARYVSTGKLRYAHKLPGRTGSYLFRRADVEQLRDAQRAEVDARRARVRESAAVSA